MLTREIMGLLALGVLWLNAGLVLAVALKQLANLRALRRRFADAKKRGELVEGKVTEGRFAVRRITQTGRAITTKGADRILFTDGPQSFEVFGGVIETGDGSRLEVAAAQPAASEVWVDERRAAETLACRDAADFERAWGPANTFKGFTRDTEIAIEAGDRVWVLGARDGDRIAAGATGLLVSMVDPVAFCASRGRLIVLFVSGAMISLALVTALSLWPPVFGLVSTLGGALGLAYFLAVQPLGTAVRDAVKTPGRRTVGALWQRPARAAARVAA